jgi:hypothetical protein
MDTVLHLSSSSPLFSSWIRNCSGTLLYYPVTFLLRCAVHHVHDAHTLECGVLYVQYFGERHEAGNGRSRRGRWTVVGKVVIFHALSHELKVDSLFLRTAQDSTVDDKEGPPEARSFVLPSLVSQKTSPRRAKEASENEEQAFDGRHAF